MKPQLVHGFNLNPIYKKFQAVPAEKELLTDLINKSYEFGIGFFDANRDCVRLVREIKSQNGIIPGILQKKPGLFWMDEYKSLRQNISNYFKEKGLVGLSDDILGYGKEENKGLLLIDDPATKRFLTGLKEHIAKADIRENLAKILLNR